jgi:hypothetical protein
MVSTAAPPFPRAWKGTRDALHAYVQAIGALARHDAPTEPIWGHRGLRLEPHRLTTAPVPLPSGGHAVALLDLVDGAAVVTVGTAEARWNLAEAAPGEVAEGIRLLAASHGVTVDPPDRPEGPPPGEEVRAGAGSFAPILEFASRLIGGAAALLPGWRTPQRFWPHGFDLSLVWFGGPDVPEGQEAESGPRITIGFDPTTEPYFYVNPWPFHAEYTACALPEGASWHTRGWRGTLLPYHDATQERLDRLAAAIQGVVDR